MGEPVTEEMLSRIDCFDYATDDERLLVAEVRRLRTLASREDDESALVAFHALARADAAGYARAERDVLHRIATTRERIINRAGDPMMTGHAVGILCALESDIEQGAHRGASERAETGGEESGR